jgi:hypothetical protein
VTHIASIRLTKSTSVGTATETDVKASLAALNPKGATAMHHIKK